MDFIHLPCWADTPSFFDPGRSLPGGRGISETEAAWLAGTGLGAARAGLPGRGLPHGLSDPFVLVHGTGIRTFEADLLLEEMDARGADALVATDPGGFHGAEMLSSPAGRVTGFTGESSTNMRDSGIWLLRRCAVDAADPAGPSPSGYIRAMMDAGVELCSENLASYCRTVTAPGDFILLCADILGGAAPAVPFMRSPGPSPWRAGVVVDPGALVEGGTVITGWSWIAAGAVIEGGCMLDNCVVLEDARVGRDSAIRNALLLPGACTGPRSGMTDKYIKIIGG